MVIKRYGSQEKDVKTTGCSFCGKDLREGQGFSDHWPHCPENPANSKEADA